jgi:hypothetical protein
MEIIGGGGEHSGKEESSNCGSVGDADASGSSFGALLGAQKQEKDSQAVVPIDATQSSGKSQESQSLNKHPKDLSIITSVGDTPQSTSSLIPSIATGSPKTQTQTLQALYEELKHYSQVLMGNDSASPPHMKFVSIDGDCEFVLKPNSWLKPDDEDNDSDVENALGWGGGSNLIAEIWKQRDLKVYDNVTCILCYCTEIQLTR